MKNKLLEIINHYGVIPQLKYFQSEVFELTEAILDTQHENNINIAKVPSKKHLDHIAEEIADVLVMLEQFRIYYGIDLAEVKRIGKYKINRQMERLKNE